MNFVESIENYIKKMKDKITSQQIAAFISVCIFGFIAHGYVIFNRLSYHDNSASLFSLGGTYESGRWMLGIVYDIMMKTSKLYSVPVFNGLVSILLIAIAAMVMIDIFKIESKLLSVFVAGMMIVYPVVTGIFSYMFTSWAYFLGMLLSIKAARNLIKEKTIKSFIISGTLLSMSLGFYQAFFAVTIVIFLIDLTVNVIENKTDSVASYAKNGFLYLGNLVLGLGLWAMIRTLSMRLKGITAVDYKGMNEGYDLSLLPNRLALAYKEFFGLKMEKINILFYLRFFTAVIIVITIIQLIILLVKSSNKISLKIASIVGIVIMPVGMNLVYILSTSEDYLIDTLMMYGNIFVFLLPVVLIQLLDNTEFVEGLGKKVVAIATSIQAISLVVMLVGYVYLDNSAYLKADIVQQQAIAWYTELVANIKCSEGYTDDMEIILVGIDNLSDETFTKIDNGGQLEAIQVAKYPDYVTILSNGGSLNFAREHIGFGNEKVTVDDGTMTENEIVKSMPTYPSEGSVRVIDNKLIVKLGVENNEGIGKEDSR